MYSLCQEENWTAKKKSNVLWTAHIQFAKTSTGIEWEGEENCHMLCMSQRCSLGMLGERIRTIDRQEREDILDSEVNWRCADCVSSDRFRPSAILEEFSQIHGKQRMLLIRWSGYEMAEGSLTQKNHLETDYTRLQAQLMRRRTERSRHQQDRYGRSVLACKYAPVGVKKLEGWTHSDWIQFKGDGRRGQKMTKLITDGVWHIQEQDRHWTYPIKKNGNQ